MPKFSTNSTHEKVLFKHLDSYIETKKADLSRLNQSSAEYQALEKEIKNDEFALNSAFRDPGDRGMWNSYWSKNSYQQKAKTHLACQVESIEKELNALPEGDTRREPLQTKLDKYKLILNDTTPGKFPGIPGTDAFKEYVNKEFKPWHDKLSNAKSGPVLEVGDPIEIFFDPSSGKYEAYRHLQAEIKKSDPYSLGNRGSPQREALEEKNKEYKKIIEGGPEFDAYVEKYNAEIKTKSGPDSGPKSSDSQEAREHLKSEIERVRTERSKATKGSSEHTELDTKFKKFQEILKGGPAFDQYVKDYEAQKKLAEKKKQDEESFANKGGTSVKKGGSADLDADTINKQLDNKISQLAHQINGLIDENQRSKGHSNSDNWIVQMASAGSNLGTAVRLLLKAQAKEALMERLEKLESKIKEGTNAIKVAEDKISKLDGNNPDDKEKIDNLKKEINLIKAGLNKADGPLTQANETLSIIQKTADFFKNPDNRKWYYSNQEREMLVDPQNKSSFSKFMHGSYLSATADFACATVGTTLSTVGSVVNGVVNPFYWGDTYRTIAGAAREVQNKGFIGAAKDSLANAWDSSITQRYSRAGLISQTGNKVIDNTEVPQQSPQKN